MKISFEKKNFDEVSTEALFVPCMEKRLPSWAVEMLKEAGVEKDFDGSKGKRYLLPAPEKTYKRLILIGLGKEEKTKVEDFRLAGGKAYGIAKGNRLEKCALWVNERMELSGGSAIQAFVEGFVLKGLKLDVYKTQEKEEENSKKEVKKLVVV